MPTEVDATIAEVRGRLFEAVVLTDDVEGQKRTALVKIAAFIADEAGLLPRAGIAAALGKERAWVTWAIAEVTRAIGGRGIQNLPRQARRSCQSASAFEM